LFNVAVLTSDGELLYPEVGDLSMMTDSVSSKADRKNEEGRSQKDMIELNAYQWQGREHPGNPPSPPCSGQTGFCP